MIEDPEAVGPRSDYDVNQAELFAEEEGAFGVHFTRELFEVVEELGLLLLQAFLTLVLQEAVIGWDDSRSNIYGCQQS